MSNKFNNKGRFGLWKNRDRKEATYPHLSGQGETLDGSPAWISAWFSKDLAEEDKAALAAIVKRYEGTSQKPFINVVIKLKQQEQSVSAISAQNNTSIEDEIDGFDDDIPF